MHYDFIRMCLSSMLPIITILKIDAAIGFVISNSLLYLSVIGSRICFVAELANLAKWVVLHQGLIRKRGSGFARREGS